MVSVVYAAKTAPPQRLQERQHPPFQHHSPAIGAIITGLAGDSKRVPFSGKNTVLAAVAPGVGDANADSHTPEGFSDRPLRGGSDPRVNLVARGGESGALAAGQRRTSRPAGGRRDERQWAL